MEECRAYSCAFNQALQLWYSLMSAGWRVGSTFKRASQCSRAAWKIGTLSSWVEAVSTLARFYQQTNVQLKQNSNQQRWADAKTRHEPCHVLLESGKPPEVKLESNHKKEFIVSLCSFAIPCPCRFNLFSLYLFWKNHLWGTPSAGDFREIAVSHTLNVTADSSS